jgi:hypothetical protein
MPSVSQLVNHVNPMVSGHPIIKPTITLRRLNLQDVPSSCPVEELQSPLPELNEGIVFYSCHCYCNRLGPWYMTLCTVLINVLSVAFCRIDCSLSLPQKHIIEKFSPLQ